MHATVKNRDRTMRNPRCSLLTLLTGSALLSALPVQPASAQGTPWIAEPGTGSVNLTFANQNATEFYRQTERVPGPLADSHLAQNTMWFGVNYAVTDAVALDVQSAWASSSLPGAAGPSGGEEGYSGLFDSNVAVTWRFVDELISDAPSVALRVGAIVAGGYDTGYINSLGDGGNGIETSLIIGRFGSAAGFSGEIGYRARTSTEVNPNAVGAMAGDQVDIPNEMFLNLGVFIPAGNVVTLGVDYRMVNALSGIDIGGEGFSPSRFPGLHEDGHIVGGRLIASVTDLVSVNAFFGQVVRGRNIAASRIFGAGLSFGFGGSF